MEIELWVCYGELDIIRSTVASGVGIIFALFEATCEESARSDSYALLHPCTYLETSFDDEQLRRHSQQLTCL